MFVTSGTTVTVYCPFVTLVAAQITPVFTSAAAAANGQLSIFGTLNADKTLTVASNAVTVGRAAGTDSALGFFITFFGR